MDARRESLSTHRPPVPAMEQARWDDHLFLRLDEGDEIHASVQSAMASLAETAAAVTSGIGRIRDVDMGYLGADGVYQRVVIEGPVELLSMQGNVANLDGKPFTHLHIVVSDNEHVVHGGHLFSATVHVTGEFHLRIFPEGHGAPMTRCHIEGSEFKPLSFE